MSDTTEAHDDGAKKGKAPKEVGAKKAPKDEAPPLLDVHFDVAKTSRAKCGGCGETLDAGVARIAKEINSQHGKIVKSYHPACAITITFNEDNRSKCATCGEKLTQGDYRVKVGCSSKTGPGTKHHFGCLFEGTVGKATNDPDKLKKILSDKKALISEADRPAVSEPKKKKAKQKEAEEDD